MPKSTNPLIRRRSAQSPLQTAKRQKLQRSTSTLSSHLDNTEEERLEDSGIPPSLAPPGVAQDVESLIHHIRANMWTAIPERGAGMGSERISAVLRFRASLPPIVSLAHLYALSASPTATEREIARLVAGGVVRKLVVPGRGKGGGGSVGEGVVLVSDWKQSVLEAVGLREEVRGKYLRRLDGSPESGLSREEVQQLVQAGYLTSPSALASDRSNTLFSQQPSLSRSLSESGSKAATGTLAAVGGMGAFHDISSGGGGSNSSSQRKPHPSANRMTPSLPSTARYLSLLTSSRVHLVFLLKQLSPRFKEATVALLKEKWDGNINGEEGGKGRGSVMPGKTRKWKEFYGVRFEWVLEEAVGAGVVERFGTGMGDVGVRAI